ncbi:MAG: hypothetical protein D6687_01175 [Acidobacteria bacterium]|jgi:hypothetical protein|nr:MAG: hypothetical protein D6687_01175 [Acidobacteriota bacterium]GIU82018.1 MAG: hypothetical protein KatS3mg006_1082 [Pyrinomonadaceae bacterium]
MNWIIERVPELSGYTVEWAEPGNFYLSRKNELFHSTTLKPPFEKIAVIDAPLWKQIASKSRLIQRLLRFMVTNVIPLGNGYLFVTFDKSVGIVSDGKFRPLKGLVRPCRVLRSACAIDKQGNIFFGEYLANEERGEMRIYKYPRGSDTLEVAYVFPPKSIRHIHGLYFDHYTDSIFCLTGDKERECKILRSFDEFKTVEVIGQGDETWRAVSILFDRNYFYYGTDAEFRTNQIFKVNRKTLERISLGEVNGTVFYSKKLGENLFFATTAENAPSQTENVATLWCINKNETCQKLISFKKDIYPPTLFMFGIIHFPFVNKLQNELYFHLVGVKEDNQTFRVKS